jgi:hypothetical protein
LRFGKAGAGQTGARSWRGFQVRANPPP